MSYTEQVAQILRLIPMDIVDCARILSIVSDLEMRYNSLLEDERESLGK